MKKWKIYSIIITVILVLVIVGICAYVFIFRESVTEEEAKNIAMEHANVSENDITISSINKDGEDRVYEIYFYDNTYEYEVDVNYNNGKIHNYEKDIRNNYNANSNINTNANNTVSVPNANNVTNNNEYIGEERAKEFVLEHASLNNNDVTFHKIELDLEHHHTATYEIEFYYNNSKYDYELNALTGEVLKYEKENMR